MIKLLQLSAFCILASACASPPVAKSAKLTPVPASNPPEAVKIEKATNVSFSTYSKDWPVGWQWIDPDEQNNPTPKNVKSGVLRVQIPNGKDLYGDNRSAPRYIKPITGDFQIETRVKFLPKENYQGAGLLIYAGDNDYIRFERAYGGIGGGADGIRVDHRTDVGYTPLVTPDDLPTEAGEVDLRIVRTGTTFLAYWRLNDEAPWREAAEIETDYPETIFAGLIACNTAREITADFAFIKLFPAIAARSG
ncbi:MAG: DUF1349 domain-containing protein [Pyrinomonadaceae bacterium]